LKVDKELEYWGNGVVEFWSGGVLEYWEAGKPGGFR